MDELSTGRRKKDQGPFDIRTRRNGKLEHLATLNGTAVTARTVIALLENFQDESGSYAVPDVLEQFGARGRVRA